MPRGLLCGAEQEVDRGARGSGPRRNRAGPRTTPNARFPGTTHPPDGGWRGRATRPGSDGRSWPNRKGTVRSPGRASRQRRRSVIAMRVITGTARRRWATNVLAGVGALCGLPALVGALPVHAAAVDPGQLRMRILAADAPYAGYAERLGSLGLPDLPAIGDVGGLLGGRTAMRTWYASATHWRGRRHHPHRRTRSLWHPRRRGRLGLRGQSAHGADRPRGVAPAPGPVTCYRPPWPTGCSTATPPPTGCSRSPRAA